MIYAVEWKEKGRWKWDNAYTIMGLEMIIENLIADGVEKFSVEVVNDGDNVDDDIEE